MLFIYLFISDQKKTKKKELSCKSLSASPQMTRSEFVFDSLMYFLLSSLIASLSSLPAGLSVCGFGQRAQCSQSGLPDR